MGKKNTIERIREILSVWWFQPNPLKNMSSSVGMIILNIWKNVPNHQPVVYYGLSCREINMKRGAVPTAQMYSVLVCGTTEWWMIGGCDTI